MKQKDLTTLTVMTVIKSAGDHKADGGRHQASRRPSSPLKATKLAEGHQVSWTPSSKLDAIEYARCHRLSRRSSMCTTGGDRIQSGHHIFVRTKMRPHDNHGRHVPCHMTCQRFGSLLVRGQCLRKLFPGLQHFQAKLIHDRMDFGRLALPVATICNALHGSHSIQHRGCSPQSQWQLTGTPLLFRVISPRCQNSAKKFEAPMVEKRARVAEK